MNMSIRWLNVPVAYVQHVLSFLDTWLRLDAAQLM